MHDKHPEHAFIDPRAYRLGRLTDTRTSADTASGKTDPARRERPGRRSTRRLITAWGKIREAVRLVAAVHIQGSRSAEDHPPMDYPLGERHHNRYAP